MLRDTRPVLMVGAGVLVGLPILFGGLQSELAPTEDQGEVIVDMKAPEAANLEFLEEAKRVAATLIDVPESGIVYVVSGVGSALNRGWGGVMLSHWRERHRSAKEIMTALQENLPTVEGIAATAFLPAPLPGSVGASRFNLSCPLPTSMKAFMPRWRK